MGEIWMMKVDFFFQCTSYSIDAGIETGHVC